MTDNFERDFAERFRQLDQPIQVDTSELATRLAAIRNQRQRQRQRTQTIAVIVAGCVAIFGLAYQLLPNDGDPTSMATKAVDDDWQPISLADFEFPVDSFDQKAELDRLRAKTNELKRTSQAQHLTLVRESVSRKMFQNDSTLSLFE